MFLSLVQGLSIFACSCPGRERHREIVRPGYVYTLETTPGAVVSGHEVIRMLELLDTLFFDRSEVMFGWEGNVKPVPGLSPPPRQNEIDAKKPRNTLLNDVFS